MMRRLLSAVLVLAALGAGFAVMRLKVAISDERAAINRLAAQVKSDVAAMRVLEAEIAFQASPRRLQDAVIAHTPLMPLRPEQRIQSIDQIPFRRSVEAVDGSARLLRTPRDASAASRVKKKKVRTRAGEV